MPEAKTEWYVAEGQASDFFAMFVLLANPNANPTQVTLRYLMPGRAPTTKVLNLPGNSRYTIEIGNQNDAPGVANTDVSVEVKATLPIVVERAMYWPKNGARWTDGHDSAGVTSTGTTWALAEGEFGGSRGFQTYVLMANPSDTDAAVRMTLLREGEGRQPLSLEFTVPANQRVTSPPRTSWASASSPARSSASSSRRSTARRSWSNARCIGTAAANSGRRHERDGLQVAVEGR